MYLYDAWISRIGNIVNGQVIMQVPLAAWYPVVDMILTVHPVLDLYGGMGHGKHNWIIYILLTLINITKIMSLIPTIKSTMDTNKKHQPALKRTLKALNLTLLLLSNLPRLLLSSNINQIHKSLTLQPSQRLPNPTPLDTSRPILKQTSHNRPRHHHKPQLTASPASPQSALDTSLPRRVHGRAEEVEGCAAAVAQEGERQAA